MREIGDSLARAFERIDDFQAVQRGRSTEELREAVECLQESVGIRGDQRSLIVERLAGIRRSESGGGDVLLGLILGLLAAEEA